ncbi:MAG: NnrU family protein [Roseobacter sp.]
MLLLIAGLILWSFAHYFKRLLPDLHASFGAAGRAIMGVGILISLLMLIFGYRSADFISIWHPPSFMTPINNILMLLALWVFGSSAAKGAKAWPGYQIRHPELTGFKIWAVAHLLVNGDLASILLFTGLLAWAVGSVILINKTEPEWTPPEKAGIKTYVRLSVIVLVLFALIASVHVWFGLSPFPR